MRGLQRYSVDEPVSEGTRLAMEYAGSVGTMVTWETAELSDRVERMARDEEETTRVFNNEVGRLNRELTEVRDEVREMRTETLGTRPPVLTRYLLSTLWFRV